MKNIFRSRRHRNPHQNDDQQREKPFFSKSNETAKQPFFSAAKGLPVQTKLSIGQPGDAYEREADAVADRVISGQGQTPIVQRQEISAIQRATLATPQEDEPVQMAAMEEEEPIQKATIPEEEEPVQMKEEEEEPVQMKSDAGAAGASNHLSSRIQNTAGNGKPMPAKTRAEMEHSFGVDFSSVNIHTDTEAVQMNKELGAQAFTHGKDVYFNSGKYNPDDSGGKHLLAHELTHVVQQGAGKEKKVQKFSMPWPINGRVINNYHAPVTVWSDAGGCYTIAAGASSGRFSEDVDFVRSPRGTWYKIGSFTVTVDSSGVVSGELRVATPEETSSFLAPC
ncbi:MAG: DUF4157 domain-containing protein [Saprospiraceae bacterium]|nr:DUF4157 domain-containing protein [Saprospiraceae bacterium]